MSIIQGNAKQGSTRGFYPKVINGSLRFNDDDGAYLIKDFSGTPNTHTFSLWLKRGNLGTTQMIATARNSTTAVSFFGFNSSDQLYLYLNSTSIFTTTAVFRDPSAWYHIVLSVTQNGSVYCYVNNEQVASGSVGSSSYLFTSSSGFTNTIGRYGDSATDYVDGYLADVHFIDGQALTADDFGELKNGVWVAKDYAGTYGTNGFYLTFEDDTEVEAFNTVLYRSQQPQLSVTGFGFKPDLVILKTRGISSGSTVIDSVRGGNYMLSTASTGAESSTSGKGILSFDSDGFTLGLDADIGSSNYSNGYDYVAWGWKAGDSNVSNTDGSITSTVRANDTYGFSIISYTGNATDNATIGHGLSTTPDFIITKERDNAEAWGVYHSSIDNANYHLRLNETSALIPATTVYKSANSSTYTVGTSGLVNTATSFIAYCWAEKANYSSFGSYTGNGSTTGPTVTTGFKPAWVMIKAISSGTTERWCIHDNTRTVANGNSNVLFADASLVENTSLTYDIDFLDTGFQIKTSHESHNQDTKEYIYAAFADTREAAFWLDQSGNDNDWQPVNLDHNDTVADSPTNNFATINVLKADGAGGYGVLDYASYVADGNLRITGSGNSDGQYESTIKVTSGKYYAEVTNISGDRNIIGIGFYPSGMQFNAATVTYFTSAGQIQINASVTDSVTAVTSTSDVVGIALNADDQEVSFYLNNTLLATKSFSTSNPIGFFGNAYKSVTAATALWNFGQQPFKYDPPA